MELWLHLKILELPCVNYSLQCPCDLEGTCLLLLGLATYRDLHVNILVINILKVLMGNIKRNCYIETFKPSLVLKHTYAIPTLAFKVLHLVTNTKHLLLQNHRLIQFDCFIVICHLGPRCAFCLPQERQCMDHGPFCPFCVPSMFCSSTKVLIYRQHVNCFACCFVFGMIFKHQLSDICLLSTSSNN